MYLLFTSNESELIDEYTPEGLVKIVINKIHAYITCKPSEEKGAKYEMK